MERDRAPELHCVARATPQHDLPEQGIRRRRVVGDWFRTRHFVATIFAEPHLHRVCATWECRCSEGQRCGVERGCGEDWACGWGARCVSGVSATTSAASCWMPEKASARSEPSHERDGSSATVPRYSPPSADQRTPVGAVIYEIHTCSSWSVDGCLT